LEAVSVAAVHGQITDLSVATACVII
jgi:hypothetical protein